MCGAVSTRLKFIIAQYGGAVIMPCIRALNPENPEDRSFRNPHGEALFLSPTDEDAKPRMSAEATAATARNATLPPRSTLAATQEARRPLFRQR